MPEGKSEEHPLVAQQAAGEAGPRSEAVLRLLTHHPPPPPPFRCGCLLATAGAPLRPTPSLPAAAAAAGPPPPAAAELLSDPSQLAPITRSPGPLWRLRRWGAD